MACHFDVSVYFSVEVKKTKRTLDLRTAAAAATLTPVLAMTEKVADRGMRQQRWRRCATLVRGRRRHPQPAESLGKAGC